MVNTLPCTLKNLVHRWLGSSGYYVGKKELAFANSFFIVIIKKFKKSL